MGQYAAPLRDMQFVLHELLNVEAEIKQMPKHADLDADTINAVLEEAGKFCSEVLFPLNQSGDQEGCTYAGDGVVTHAEGLQGSVSAVRRSRLARARLRSRIRRPGPAGVREQRAVRNAELGESGVDDVSGPLARRLRMSARARHAGAAAALSAEARLGRVDRHDVPDRAALRHRPRHPAHQGRAEQRRLVRDHRHEDLHLQRRTRSRREHRSPGARASAGCADGHQGHFAFHRAEVRPERSRRARRAQRREVRLHRTQDGHSRQRDLRDQSRQRARAGSSASRTRA